MWTRPGCSLRVRSRIHRAIATFAWCAWINTNSKFSADDRDRSAWRNTNSKCMVDAPLYPSCTSSLWSRLLLVPRLAMRTGNECKLEDRGMARRRSADICRDDRRDAGGSAIVRERTTGRRRRSAFAPIGRAAASRAEAASRIGREPPRRPARADEPGCRRRRGRPHGDRHRSGARLSRRPERHRHQDRHAAARDAAIDHGGHRRPRHRPGRAHRAGNAALRARRIRRRLWPGCTRRLSAHPRTGPECLSRRHARREHVPVQRMAARSIYARAHRGAARSGIGALWRHLDGRPAQPRLEASAAGEL